MTVTFFVAFTFSVHLMFNIILSESNDTEDIVCNSLEEIQNRSCASGLLPG